MKQLLIALVFTFGLTQSKGFAQVDLDLKFNHVALSVSNLEASVTFYAQVLQLQQITNRTQNPAVRWMSLGQDKELHLVSAIAGEVQLNKAVHFAVSTPNFDAFIARLKTLKIPYSDWPGAPNTITTRADGVQQVYIQDPDGYWIEINSANK